MADSHPAASYFRSFAEVARPESPLYFALAVDWVGSDDHLEFRGGQAQADGIRRTTLARVHHHGAWLDWVA